MPYNKIEVIILTENELMKLAVGMTERSYAPYSGFTVGAALLCGNGRVYTGCNIENASFTPTVCAERCAIFEAVKNGERDFKMIAVAGGMHGEVKAFTYPCGVCRQVMLEFCGPDFVLLFTDGREIKKYTLAEIMPLSFTPADLDAPKEGEKQ